jgi:sensor histidine kinase YesM
LQVSDNGPGPAPGAATAPDTHGATRERVGLNNTRERLRKLYGDNQQFDLIKNTMGGVTARLSIPFRLVPTAAGG